METKIVGPMICVDGEALKSYFYRNPAVDDYFQFVGMETEQVTNILKGLLWLEQQEMGIIRYVLGDCDGR